MTWLNPWAWLGVTGVALPVLIHLLGRGRTRVHHFPSLRFLEPSRLLPTRRSRIQDPLLLVVRCSVIVLAAAALAQPLLLTARRRQTLDRGLARAIVVDTSASMRRVTPTGAVALDSARRAARALAAGVQASIVVESNDPGRALARAHAWLTRQGRRAELIVISDFQRGQLDSADFLSLPRGVGVALHRLPVTDSVNAAMRSSIGIARASQVGNRTDAEWSMVTAQQPTSGTVLLLGSTADSLALIATRVAAGSVAQPFPLDTSRNIAIVFPGFAERAALHASARPTYAPWMVDLPSRLLTEGFGPTGFGVARVRDRERLVLFTDVAPGSLPAAQLTAMAAGAASVAPSPRELDRDFLPDAAIASLQRPVPNDAPAPNRQAETNVPSDGRWLWLAALVLLLLEIPLRRRVTSSGSAHVEENARAA